MDKIEKLAYEIKELLDKYNYSGDTAIYFNNRRLTTFIDEGYGRWVLQEGYKGSDYTHYANDGTITMTFEGIGSIHDIINYEGNKGFLKELNKLFGSYGYYYELGNSWNLALYEM